MVLRLFARCGRLQCWFYVRHSLRILWLKMLLRHKKHSQLFQYSTFFKNQFDRYLLLQANSLKHTWVSIESKRFYCNLRWIDLILHKTAAWHRRISNMLYVSRMDISTGRNTPMLLQHQRLIPLRQFNPQLHWRLQFSLKKKIKLQGKIKIQ